MVSLEFVSQKLTAKNMNSEQKNQIINSLQEIEKVLQ